MPWDPDMSALLSTQWQDVDATSTLYDVALKLSVDTLPVSISAISSQLSNVLSSYVFKQCGQVIGTIDIPRDFLVKSAELKTVVEDDKPYEGAKVGDKYIDFTINDQTGSGGESHVYVPVNGLVNVYTGGTTSTISVAISSDNAIYAYVRPESIVSSLIADNAVTTSKVADGQVSLPKLSSDVIEFTESMSAAVASIADNKIFIDGISAESLCMLHISQEDFYEKVHTSSLLSNELYIVSSDYINAYGQQIKNIADPVDSSDAATKKYADTKQDILVQTTAGWQAYPNFKPDNGQIVIWSDKSTVLSTWEEDGHVVSADIVVPGIKIGNGNAYNLDLPFAGDEITAQLLQHISSNMHVTDEERKSWNHKITIGDIADPADTGVHDETLIITRN